MKRMSVDRNSKSWKESFKVCFDLVATAEHVKEYKNYELWEIAGSLADTRELGARLYIEREGSTFEVEFWSSEDGNLYQSPEDVEKEKLAVEMLSKGE